MYSLTASIPIKTVLGQHPLLVCDYWTDPRAGKKVYDEVQANLASAPGPGQALGLMIIKWCSVLSPHLIWGHTVSPIRSQYPGHVICLDQSGASIQVMWPAQCHQGSGWRHQGWGWWCGHFVTNLLTILSPTCPWPVLSYFNNLLGHINVTGFK